MPLGRPRRRRRSGRPIIVFILTVAVLGAVGAGLWYGYRVLSRDLQARIVSLTERADTLQAKLDDAERARDSLSVTLEDAKAKLRFAEARYEREVPTEDARRLLPLLRDALDRGANPDRLAFLINAGAQPLRCDAQPDVSTLLVTHPGRTRGGRDVVTADGQLTITATGATAVDDRGRPEDWFDPDQPVEVTITRRGSDPATLKGKLPLSDTVLVGVAEDRLTIKAARRGYVEVSVTHCAFP